MTMITWRVEGVYRDKWTTLFDGMSRHGAVERYKKLSEANPACRYRIRWSGNGQPIVGQPVSFDRALAIKNGFVGVAD